MNKEYYTNSFKSEIEERMKPINTVNLQLTSVKLFMGELGYSCFLTKGQRVLGTSGFKQVDIDKTITAPKFISFQDACRLHNGIYSRMVGGAWVDVLRVPYTLHITTPIWDEAHKAKLVECASLQKLRKAPYVEVQSHYVKLVGDDEWDSWFKDKEVGTREWFG
jgi:hypothetical protein